MVLKINMLSGLRLKPLAVYTTFMTLLIVSFKGRLYKKVVQEIIYFLIARIDQELAYHDQFSDAFGHSDCIVCIIIFRVWQVR